jgi:glycosyltransferase involved in cell wall biosynthesis
MNLVFLTSVAGNGGSAATAFHIAKLFNTRTRWPAVLFAPGEMWRERGKREGVPVLNSLELRQGFQPVSFYRDSRVLRKFLMENESDVVVVQKSPEQWLAFLALHTIERPIALVRMRGVVFPVRSGIFNRWLHNGFETVICSAGVIAEQYRKLEGFDQTKVKVLLEGVDTAHFAPATPEERATARRELKLDEEALLIGSAGRPSHVKGHDLLIRAFKAARAAAAEQSGTAKARLALFPDESRRNEASFDLAQLSLEAGIREHLDVRPGCYGDMRTVYQALDAYVLPSRGSEGSSRAALEASACGLPLIAGETGVLPDVVLDGVTGRLLPPGDEQALATELALLITTWPLAREWGQAARARMLERFTEERYFEGLCDLLVKAHQSAKRKAE